MCCNIKPFFLCASSNRTAAKFSLRPVTKQPKCGISTATKPCRLPRLDKRSCNVTVTVISGQSCLKLSLCASPQHDGPIKSIHWIKAPNYSCIMTGSWDKTLKVQQKLSKVLSLTKHLNFSALDRMRFYLLYFF